MPPFYLLRVFSRGIFQSTTLPQFYLDSIIKRFLPEDLVMVGDTLSDANFAKNAGIKCIGIVKTEQGKKLLDGNVTVMVEDISKITEIVE